MPDQRRATDHSHYAIKIVYKIEFMYSTLCKYNNACVCMCVCVFLHTCVTMCVYAKVYCNTRLSKPNINEHSRQVSKCGGEPTYYNNENKRERKQKQQFNMSRDTNKFCT